MLTIGPDVPHNLVQNGLRVEETKEGTRKPVFLTISSNSRAPIGRADVFGVAFKHGLRLSEEFKIQQGTRGHRR